MHGSFGTSNGKRFPAGHHLRGRRGKAVADRGASPAAGAGHGDKAEEVRVRDLPVRLFHWALLMAVSVALFTGYLGPENLLGVHVLAGQAVAVLVLFRIAWWFMGGRYSRLAAYPLAPRRAIAHLRTILRGRSPMRAGHNPLGAWMIVMLMALLLLLAISGIITLAGTEDLGPLKAVIPHAIGSAAREAHEALAALLLLAIAGHLGGVLLETVVFRHPLLRAMTRGSMPVSPARAEPRPLALRGAAVLAAVLAIFTAAWVAPQRLLPDARWRPLAMPPAYAENCADCHTLYHPSLRTARAWRRIIAGLADHYGEDASVDADTARRIIAFLTANDANTFDTEAAVRLGRIETADMRITSVPWWKKRHARLAEAVFKAPTVGSKANCGACHKDAQTGRFDDANIRLPEGARKQTDSTTLSPNRQTGEQP